jgi:hypothetical protein
VEEREARAVLGVAAHADRDAVRAAYRRLIREAHPDLVGAHRGPEAARLNEAYAVLVRARAPRRAPQAPQRPATAAATHPGQSRPGPLPDGTTLRLPWPPAESFVRVVDAAQALGEVTYVDRSCAILEVVVDLEGEACSLLCTLAPAGDGTDVECSIEALERVATLPAAGVTSALARLLRAQRSTA